jgi:nucleoside-diphosphate-sugar epimerase
MNSHDVLPAYYPLDERIPRDIDDWYSLSKAADELTASMANRHWGIDVLAYRFPATSQRENLERHSARLVENPGNPGSVREGWSYLDVRDAARAAHLGLTADVPGAHVVFVTAPNTLVPYPTQDLLERYAPAVPRLRRFVGREVPIDQTVAKSLIGFEA